MAALSITYDLLLLSLYYLLPITYYLLLITSPNLLLQTYFPLFAFISVHINSSYYISTMFECR